MSAQKFFNKAIENNGKPRVVNIDESGSNYSAIRRVNRRGLFKNNMKITTAEDCKCSCHKDQVNKKSGVADEM